MKTPTKKVFVHISASYTPKNGLERLISSNLRELDNTIHKTGQCARMYIRKVVKDSVRNYPNSKRCKEPLVSFWKNLEVEGCRVNDLIQLSIHPVYKYSNL